ncbi:Plant transposase (Ptta/En/Spm family) [Carex littledalei]|uniref:Plant transposase (Ptta/En/Spm family) n=1 Tax=Carex littledalei TaxID=544730 RepID=A0A833QP30_9POAL|nr:Plant transposase (Ptta/En/Spm family) [Carex littledalei]
MAAQQNWPSHARRARIEEHEGNGLTENIRNVRGVVKGHKATKKWRASKPGKLPIQFSMRLGGAIGVHRRSFIDEIVIQMRQHAPLIGVETWSKVSNNNKKTIVEKVLDHWDLKDDESTKQKILKIAGQRYKTWRSNLAATYRAYATDEERLKHKPEELSMDDWKHLIYYFGTEKFKKKSETNSANRGKRKFNHSCGSKSFSQMSYENRDKDTQEEPNDLNLWLITHSKGGKWLDAASKELYENVQLKIGEREDAIGELLSPDEQNQIFQDVAGDGSGYLHGRGYMAKSTNSDEGMNEQLKECLEINANLTARMEEVQESNAELRAELAEERATRERQVRSMEESISQRVRQEIMAAFGHKM